jgi:hypothetical protein
VITCSDINECKDSTDRCNVGGNFTGFKFVSNGGFANFNNVRCENSIGSHSCLCKYPGYNMTTDVNLTSPEKNVSLPFFCDDWDECAADWSGNMTCNLTVTSCENTDGSFTCECGYGGRRRNGYQPNPVALAAGKTSHGPLAEACMDVDECKEDISLSLCNYLYTPPGQLAAISVVECVNTIGSFECRCVTGFSDANTTLNNRGGKELFCLLDTDECNATATTNSTGDPCSTFSNTKCFNTFGSYECPCIDDLLYSARQSGWGSGNYTTTIGWEKVPDNSGNCRDIDECQIESANCAANAKCMNTNGSFTCSCNTGFVTPAVKKSAEQTNCASSSYYNSSKNGLLSAQSEADIVATVVNPLTQQTALEDASLCMDMDECLQCGTSTYAYAAHKDLSDTFGMPCGNMTMNGQCFNLYGSKQCVCNSGYSQTSKVVSINGTDKTFQVCSDYDECAQGPFLAPTADSPGSMSLLCVGCEFNETADGTSGGREVKVLKTIANVGACMTECLSDLRCVAIEYDRSTPVAGANRNCWLNYKENPKVTFRAVDVYKDSARLRSQPGYLDVYVKRTSEALSGTPNGATSRVNTGILNRGHECGTGTCVNSVNDTANLYECKCGAGEVPTGQRAPPLTCVVAGQAGSYCADALGNNCDACPKNMWSLANAIGKWSCYCNAGYKKVDDDTCELCPANTFAPDNSTVCTACNGSNIFSLPGSASEAACICNAGYYKSKGAATSVNESCTGREWGSLASPCAACPNNSISNAGANAQLDNCFCKPGYTKVVDPGDALNWICVEDYQCKSDRHPTGFCNPNAVCVDEMTTPGDPTCYCDNKRGFLDQPVGSLKNWCLQLWYTKSGLLKFPVSSIATTPNVVNPMPDLQLQGLDQLMSAAILAGGLEGFPDKKPYNLAAVFAGTVKITAGGNYTFCVNSSDGAQLALQKVDGSSVVFADTAAGRLSNGDSRHSPVSKCATKEISSGDFAAKLYYFVFKNDVFLKATYSGPDTFDVAVNLESTTSGNCNAAGAHQCFVAPAVADCGVNFTSKADPSRAVAKGEEIGELSWTFRVDRPMERGQHVTLNMGDFTDAMATSQDRDISFYSVQVYSDGPFTTKQKTRPEFGVPNYAKIGCFEDGLTRSGGRAIGGGKCRTMLDASIVVANRDQCYQYAKSQGNPGFCMTRSYECFTTGSGTFESAIAKYSFWNQTGCPAGGNGAAGYMDCYFLYNSSYAGTGTGLPAGSSSSSSSHSSSSSSSSGYNCSGRFPDRMNAMGPNCSNASAPLYQPTDAADGTPMELQQKYCSGGFKCGKFISSLMSFAFIAPVRIAAGTNVRIVWKNPQLKVPRYGLGLNSGFQVFPQVNDPSVGVGATAPADKVLSDICTNPEVRSAAPVALTVTEDAPINAPTLEGSNAAFSTPAGFFNCTGAGVIKITFGESGASKKQKTKGGSSTGGANLKIKITKSADCTIAKASSMQNDVSPSVFAAI